LKRILVFFAFLSACAGGVRAEYPFDFEAPRYYGSTESPYFVEKADFDGDGILDLAVSDRYGYCVNIMLGRMGGDGHFTLEQYASVPVFERPHNLSLPDLDGDGILDMIVGMRNQGGVRILVGGGEGCVWDGTFVDLGFFFTGLGAYDSAVDDFDGDSIPDIAVANDALGASTGDSVSVLIGTGENGVWNGGFESPRGYMVDLTPQMVISHDFNADGAPDLVTANAHASNVSVLLGVGDGTFLPRVDYTVGSGPHSVVVGDFNEDGIADLATSNWNHDNVSVLLGNGSGGVGDGTFAPSRGYRAGDAPRRVVVGDFDEDGIDDLATCDYYGRTVTFIRGRGEGGVGNGLFYAGISYPAGGMAYSIVTHDFDGDGALDLATAYPREKGVCFLPGNGDGTVRTLSVASVGEGAGGVARGDLNGDGIIDLAVSCAAESRVDVLLGGGASGVGDGTFQLDSSWAAGSGPEDLLAVDVNDDGRLDLVTADRVSLTLSVLIGGGAGPSGDGTFAPPVAYGLGAAPAFLAAADFNNDGIGDLAVTEMDEDAVALLLGNGSGGVGDGTFGPPAAYPVPGGPWGLAAVDLDDDGRVDLAVACREGGGVHVLMNAGWDAGGVYFASPVFYDCGDQPWGIAAADLDGDGAIDLAVTDAAGGDVAVLMGRTVGGVPSGSLESACFYAAGLAPTSILAYDGEGDGVLDLVVTDSLCGALVVLGNVRGEGGTGTGTFEEPVSYGVGGRLSAMAAADFNGDGADDLALAGAPMVEGLDEKLKIVLRGMAAIPVATPESGIAPVVRPVQLSPKPFNGSVRVSFDLARRGRTTVAVYDLAGRRVRLALDRPLPAGFHELYWDGSSDGGPLVASGVYFIRVDSDDLHCAEKVLFIR